VHGEACGAAAAPVSCANAADAKAVTNAATIRTLKTFFIGRKSSVR
jgi:hypothetical protein